MKAYVIKNKEGKYYCGFSFIISSDKFENDIKGANIFEEYELNMFKLTKDCTFVPITICEGDLEEENRVLKKALELACEKISSWEMNMPKDKMKDYFIQQAKESEKDG